MTVADKLAALVSAGAPALTPDERDSVLMIGAIVTASDGRLDDEELAALRAIAVKVDALVDAWNAAPTDVEALFNQVPTTSADVEARIHHHAGKLRSSEARALAYLVAYGLVRADQETSDEEFVLDLTLIDALELSNEDASALAGKVDAALSADA
jgi:hypothetical protein